MLYILELFSLLFFIVLVSGVDCIHLLQYVNLLVVLCYLNHVVCFSECLSIILQRASNAPFLSYTI
jgi:hypothetical protein